MDVVKRKVFTDALQQGSVLVSFVTATAGVGVPKHLTREPVLSLRYNYGFQLRDFAFNGDAIEATLSFSGRPHFCRVPWAAVISMREETTGQAHVWPESEALRTLGVSAVQPAAESGSDAGPAQPKRVFEVLSGGRTETDAEPDPIEGRPQAATAVDEETQAPPKAAGGHLRRIK